MASNKRIEYVYDGHNRVTEIHRFEKLSGVYQGDTGQMTKLYWDSAPFAEGVLTQGRLAGVETYQLGTWQESFNYSSSGLVTKKKMIFTIPGLGPARTVQSTHGYNNEGQMTSITYPTVSGSTGRTLTTTYDSMARPLSMSDNQSEVTVSGVAYNHRNQMTSMTGPNSTTVGWGFNELGQLVSMGTAGVSETYHYAPGANNGRIVKKVTNGEEVVYQYDALNRLVRSTAEAWEETYSLDGFGNLTGRTSPQGSFSLGINPATNKFAASSEHDVHGNYVMSGAYQFDIENRLALANRVLDTGSDYYAYGNGNKRIYKRVEQDGQPNKHYVYLYGVAGERIGHYEVTSTQVVRLTEWYYFAGRTVAEGTGTVTAVVTDRLGNVRKRGGTVYDYYPYGQEKPSPTAGDAAKFGTYYRDAGTGLDYADQRYFNVNHGRFMSPDTGLPVAGEPGSWNRYSYVNGDPTNFLDPRGLLAESAHDPSLFDYHFGSLLSGSAEFEDPYGLPADWLGYQRLQFMPFVWSYDCVTWECAEVNVALSPEAYEFLTSQLAPVAVPVVVEGAVIGGRVVHVILGIGLYERLVSYWNAKRTVIPDDCKEEEKEPTPTNPGGAKCDPSIDGCRINSKTGEIWCRDKLHKDHWEVYRDKNRYEKERKRNRAVWDSGCIRQRF
ncbi:MAG: RHS repeat-associated core domain-containing protein [Bryobacteraceae bacterium]